MITGKKFVLDQFKRKTETNLYKFVKNNNKLDKLFKCRRCNVNVLMSLDEFKLHHRMTHKSKRLPTFARTPNEIYRCDACTMIFRSRRNLNQHMETHNEFVCDECGANFKRVLEYTLHLRTHSDDDLYKCIYCEYKTKESTDVGKHLDERHYSVKHRYSFVHRTSVICPIDHLWRVVDFVTVFFNKDNVILSVPTVCFHYLVKPLSYDNFLWHQGGNSTTHRERLW